jgi:hypothetical protein
MKHQTATLFRFLTLTTLIATLGWSGSVSAQAGTKADYPTEALNGMSPQPVLMGAFEPLHRAEAYVKAHPGSDYVVGSGDSMLPLYRDHTVLVIEPTPLSELKRGMTVVFVGDNGFPVAHTLVRQTRKGWVAMGLGNQEADDRLVRADNYIGTVIAAYEPNENPMVAILRKSPRTQAIASAN